MTNSAQNDVKKEALLLGLCASKYRQIIDDHDQLTAINTVNPGIIGIVDENIDIEDALELLSSSHTHLINLVRHMEILPVKAGTIIYDDSIEINLDQADRLLKNMEGCVEAMIKGSYLKDNIMEKVLDKLPNESAPNSEQKIMYGQRIAEAIASKREDDVSILIDRLNKRKIRDYEKRDVSGYDLCNLSILIPRQDMDNIESLLREIVDEEITDAKFEFIAPLPIYSFLN